MKKKYPGYRGDYFPDKTAPGKSMPWISDT